MVSNKAKRLVFNAVRIKPVNAGIRRLLKPISHKLPYKVVAGVPVVGEIKFELPDDKTLILVSDGCDSLASRVYWHGLEGFEPETVRLFMHLLKRSRAVIDVGAHTGLFALLAALDDKEREVYAFEPVSRIFNYLTANIVANNVHNVTALCEAVSESNGEIALHIPDSTRLPATASVLAGYRNGTDLVKVPTTTIDSFVEANQIDGIDLIKIDAEGAEAQVLRGTHGILERDRPAIICEVLYGITDESVQAEFESANYRYFLITADALVHHERIVGDETYFYKNYLFLPEERIPEVEEFTRIS